MGTSTDDLDLETWSQHPLVTTAARRLGPSYQAVDLLFELHGLMTGLEDRFPTIPFREVLACHNPGSPTDRKRIHREMTQAGVSPQDIYTLIGDPDDTLGEQEFQLALDDVPRKVLIERHGRSHAQAEAIRGVRTPPTPKELLVLDSVGDAPITNKAQLARDLGTTLDVVRKALRKRRYWAWLDQQDIDS